MHRQLEFKSVTLDLKKRIEKIRKESGNTLYSHTFTNLFLWQEDMRITVLIGDGVYLPRCAYRGDNAYMFPCGEAEKKKEIISQLCDEGSPVFYYMSDEDETFLNDYFPGVFETSEFRDDCAYLYGRESHIELAGHQYRKMRSGVNYGLSLYDWEIEKITPENLPRVKIVIDQWNKHSGHLGEADMNACILALKNYEALELEGWIFNDGYEDKAAAFGSYTSDSIFDMNVCKTLMDDIDSYVKWECYKRLPERIVYVDSEDDMGIEGLRRHKLSRMPDVMVSIKTAVLKQ